MVYYIFIVGLSLALNQSNRIIIIGSCTHSEPPGGLRSCAAPPGQDATPDSPAFSRSCYARGEGSSGWTRTHPRWCGSGTGLAGRCPRRDGEAGDPQLGRRRPHGTTGPPPGSQAPGRRWAKLTDKREPGEFRILGALKHWRLTACSFSYGSKCLVSDSVPILDLLV